MENIHDDEQITEKRMKNFIWTDVCDNNKIVSADDDDDDYDDANKQTKWIFSLMCMCW